MRKQAYLIAAIALAACLESQAMPPTDNDPFALSIPDLKGGMQMNVGGVLAKPSGGSTGGIASNSRGPKDATTAESNTQVSPDAGVGYSIPGSGNDVQMQWSSAR